MEKQFYVERVCCVGCKKQFQVAVDRYKINYFISNYYCEKCIINPYLMNVLIESWNHDNLCRIQ